MGNKNGRASVMGNGVGRPTGRFRTQAKSGAVPMPRLNDYGSRGKNWWEDLTYPHNWPEIRAFVLKRDNYTCKRCGKFRPPPWHSDLHVHHLTSGKNRSHAPRHLSTLCLDCHKAEHSHLRTW